MSLGLDDDGQPVVLWQLPASKMDQQALGKDMSHGCACAPSSLCGCPFHAAKAQLARLRRMFPDKVLGDGFERDVPLFPTRAGDVVDKEAMVDTIVKAALTLKIPLATPDGTSRVSGHSLRVSGAQGLSRLGVDTWAIQLLGRWGSATVLKYIKEVPLELSATWARRAACKATLEQQLAETRPKLHYNSGGRSEVSRAFAPPVGDGVGTRTSATNGGRRARGGLEVREELDGYVA